MAEKEGTSIAVEEFETTKILKSLIEMNGQMREKMTKMMEGTQHYPLQIAELTDLVKEKDGLILELRQELHQKTEKIEKLESKLSELGVIQRITDDPQLLSTASVEQLRAEDRLKAVLKEGQVMKQTIQQKVSQKKEEEESK